MTTGKENVQNGTLTFSLMQANEEELVLNWLGKDYVNRWFHSQGLENTISGIKAFITNNEPCFDPWIACFDGIPFAFLITSNVHDSEVDDPDCQFAKWIEPGKKSITLDLLIGEEKYLGKGLATRMIKEFLKNHHSDVEIVFIDPEVANTKATHVYEKAGFEQLDNFIATWNPVPHILMRLRTENYS